MITMTVEQGSAGGKREVAGVSTLMLTTAMELLRVDLESGQEPIGNSRKHVLLEQYDPKSEKSMYTYYTGPRKEVSRLKTIVRGHAAITRA